MLSSFPVIGGPHCPSVHCPVRHIDTPVIDAALAAAKASDKPSLIACRTIIGYGSPNKSDTAGVHGAPLGEDETALTRQQLNWNYGAFEVPQEAYDQFRQAIDRGASLEAEWNQTLATYRTKYPAEAAEFERMLRGELPEGWETNIGEDGHRLSGGQRQRIAIARAVLKDAPVLVLDEATSNVDNETEAALQRSIDRISRDRTTLIIAHRLSTIRNADTIAVMEKGQITEMGSHDNLVSQEGLYARLWSVQTGEASE